MRKLQTSDYREKEVWTAQDAADYFRCSENHVRDLAREGVIPFFRFGRRILFKKEEVFRFVSSQNEA